jgi:hypothetical protein
MRFIWGDILLLNSSKTPFFVWGLLTPKSVILSDGCEDD